MDYIIDWCEQKTTATGKIVLSCTLTDINGITHQNVSIWSDFPDFSNLAAGHSVTGNMRSKASPNGKVYKTLYPTINANPIRPRSSVPAKPGIDGSALIRQKAESITASQDKKEVSIMISGTARDAVLIVTTMYPELANYNEIDKEAAIKEEIIKWRKWLMAQWDQPIDPTSKPPFGRD